MDVKNVKFKCNVDQAGMEEINPVIQLIAQIPKAAPQLEIDVKTKII